MWVLNQYARLLCVDEELCSMKFNNNVRYSISHGIGQCPEYIGQFQKIGGFHGTAQKQRLPSLTSLLDQ